MMVDKRIIYTDPDTGNVCVVTPAPQWLQEDPKRNTIVKCAKLSVPRGIPYRIIDKDQLPQDRDFRGAWTDEYDTPTVDVDIEKAKAIHLDNLRVKRNELLNKLDREYMLALESGSIDKSKHIAGKKQRLRDMPVKALEEMANINEVEDLKQYSPDILE